MKSIALCVALAASPCFTPTALASDHAVNSPEADGRTYAQNFKDMVLADCLASAYRNEPGAATDAGSSVGALRDWTYFDMENSPDAVRALVDRYLARDYSNPLVESEIGGVKFDLLKCLDLYHGKALDDLAKRLVIHPQRRLRRDSPPPR